MPVEIASAYVSIIPTLKPLSGNLSRIFQPVEQAGQDAGDRAGDNSGKGFLGGFGGLVKGGIVGVALAAGAAFTDAFVEASDVKKSKAKLQGSLGLDPAETEKLGKAAGQLYSQGYGESMSQLTDTLGIVKSSLKDVSDVDLERITGKALSFASAFDTDVSESISSVNTLLGSGLVTDANQAFDVLTKASQKVPAALRGDIMDASDEYSQFFRTLGFDSNEAFDVLVKGSEKGAFGIDKAGDAIKEFTIRSTDMSTGSTAAYESIGLNAQDMSNQILAGGDTAQAATQQIVDGILGIKDPAAQAQAALALFGTPLEDLNTADIPKFLEGLKGTSGALGDTAGAAEQMDAAMGSTSNGLELFWRNIKTNLVDFISTTVLPKLAEFGAWFNDTFGPTISAAGEWIRTVLVPAVSELFTWLGEKLTPVVQQVGAFVRDDLLPAWQKFTDWVVGTVIPVLQPIFDYIGNTIQNVITIFSGVIDVIGGALSGDWSRVWDGIKSIFGGIWDQIVNLLSTARDLIFNLVSEIGPWVLDKITSFAGFLTDKGREFITWIWDGIVAGATKVWDWFTDLGNQIGSRVSTLVGQVTQFGVNLITWVAQGLVNATNSVLDFFTNLPANIWNAAKGAFQGAVAWGGNLIKSMVEGISKAAPYIGKAVLDAVEAVGEWLPGFNLAGAAAKSVSGDVDSLIRQMEADARANSSGSYYGGRAGTGMARGGRVPGVDPGRGIDNVLIPMRSGEGVMVPEWVNLVGGEPAIHAMNRAAERGQLVGPGYAAGGVIGAKFALVGAHLVKAVIPGIVDAVKSATSTIAGTAVAGQVAGFNASQDPSSFGWQRAQGIVPYAWNGYSFAGGVADGTQPVWNALLNQLVPQIPGGLIRGSLFGYENRDNVNSPGTPSFHSYGLALDVNASANGNGVNPAGIQGRPGAIPMNLARTLAAKLGLLWGGDFNGTKDPMHFEVHVPKSAIAGATAGAAQPATAGQPTSFLTDFASKIGSFVQSKFASMGGGASGAAPAPVSGGSFIPNVERWRPLATQALAAFGYGPEWVNAMLWQMTTESSGNPNAINLTDSNARRGTPSKGLLQTIDPTFVSSLTGTPFANLIPKGPYDPWANLLAAVSYVKRRYGGPQVWNKSVGGNPNPYDTGGWLMPGQQGINLLNKPEAVLRPDESAAYVKHAKAIGSDGAQLIQLEIHSNDPILQTIIDNAEVVVTDAFRAYRSEVRLTGSVRQ